jgi:hypothetical protein
MDIKEAKYYNFSGATAGIKLTLTDDTEVIVPRKVGNRHYAAILEWVAAGNTITTAD